MNKRRLTRKRRASLSTLILYVVCCVLPGPAHAQVPRLIRYQGQAVDSKGVPLEGAYTLTLRLYDAETAGTKVWEEVQPNVPLSKGQFSVLLGQITPLTPMDWSSPCWLAVQVNAEPELTPRQRITSVPLAIRAEMAEIVKTSGLTDDANRLVPSGSIMLWDGIACPAGYTQVTSFNDRFLVASNAAGIIGGSDQHSHDAGSYRGPSHTHNVTISHAGWTGDIINPAHNLNTHDDGQERGTNVDRTFTSAPGGDGSITGTSGVADSRPAFVTIVLCKKN